MPFSSTIYTETLTDVLTASWSLLDLLFFASQQNQPGLKVIKPMFSTFLYFHLSSKLLLRFWNALLQYIIVRKCQTLCHTPCPHQLVGIKAKSCDWALESTVRVPSIFTQEKYIEPCNTYNNYQRLNNVWILGYFVTIKMWIQLRGTNVKWPQTEAVTELSKGFLTP